MVGDDIYGQTFYFFEVVDLHAESYGNNDSCIEFEPCRCVFVSGSALDSDELLERIHVGAIAALIAEFFGDGRHKKKLKWES